MKQNITAQIKDLYNFALASQSEAGYRAALTIIE
jgi:hypothetical protein